MEISVADLLVTEFRPNPIATAASPAVTHMTARRIEVSCPCKSKLEYRTLERGIRGRSVSYFTLRISIILMETIKDLYITLLPGVLGARWPSRLVATASEDRLSVPTHTSFAAAAIAEQSAIYEYTAFCNWVR